MQMNINANAVNQFLKGSNIFIKGEPVFWAAMIVKGRVIMHSEGAKVVMGSGAFLGINDIYTGTYQCSYTALDDVMIYVFPIKKQDEIETILNVNKDYHGIMVASFYKTIHDLDQAFQNIMKGVSEIYQYLTQTYQMLKQSALKNGVAFQDSDKLLNLNMPENQIEMLRDRVQYYCACKNLPIDAVKTFYSYGNTVTMYQIEEQAFLVNQQLEALEELSKFLLTMAECMIDDTDSCLYGRVIGYASYSDHVGGVTLIDILDEMIEQINKAELFAERYLGKKLRVNRKRMEEGYHNLINNEMNPDAINESVGEHTKEEKQNALAELKDSYQKLLEYAQVESIKAVEMMKVMNHFVQLRDKASGDDGARALRRLLAEHYYEIYHKAFLRSYGEGKSSRLVEMFLRYGFADERLLTDDQLLSLYFLEEEGESEGPRYVFDIKTWLTMIYEGEREPSKNEFDLEYADTINEMKRKGQMSERDYEILAHDKEKKLAYEIQNMFRYNNRTTSGTLSSFVPVLHKDQWPGNFERIYVTPARVNDAINEILKVDYSAFFREIVYSNQEKNITREFVMKNIFPDIILMPNVGSNGVMWQEISGKKRESAGRFMLPILSEMPLKTLLVRIIGRFRWELCRTIEGSAWNNIAQKSLTSEYSEYLQFYRKNKDLSEEKKQKIKMQIQKGRNNSREVFALDYEQWVLLEAKGVVKLNKVVREIMATYCPFEKNIREQVKNQMVFEEAMAKFYREKLKKIREIEGRYRLLQRENIELTPELVTNLDFYKNQ